MAQKIIASRFNWTAFICIKNILKTWLGWKGQASGSNGLQAIKYTANGIEGATIFHLIRKRPYLDYEG